MKSLVQAARSYLGVPFRHQGRNKNGIDCVGLLFVSAWDCGYQLRDFKGYTSRPDGIILKREADSQLMPIPVSDIQPNDILLMKFMREPQHIAIVTDIGIIHSYSGVGKVVEHNLDDKWRKRIVGAYRLG